MAELPPALEHKVGPFPVVGWVGLTGGGAALGLILRRRLAAKATTAPAPTQVADASPGASPTSSSFASTASSSGRTITVPTPGVPTAPGGPTTNEEWQAAGVNYLKSTGADPAAADTALRRYLAGYALTSAEYALVSKTIGTFGPPPEGGVAPITRTPDEVPTAPSPATPTPAMVRVSSPGSLVSPDGNTVFWTDGNAVEWVTDGNRSIALWRAGARVAGDVRNEYPIPIPTTRAAILSTPHKVGPPPPDWGAWA